ncbi:MAG: hypothetical protein EBS19_02395 [Spirochaetia bacterium]|nr:hypothetical protein [Spirochaetia bacterium]
MSLTPPNEMDIKYSFLRVRREKESIILGISPTNKIQQEILKVAKNNSTVQNATKGGLFSLKKSFIESLQIEEKTLTLNLNQLVSNQFLCQIPVFEFDSAEIALEIIPYFITHPGDDKNFSIANLFEELIVCSFKSIKYWYEARSKISKEDQISEFKWYMNGNNEPYGGHSNIFNPWHILKTVNNGIPVYDEVIEYISRDIERRFIESNLAIPLKEFGIFFIKTNEVMDIFENADAFMQENIINSLIGSTANRTTLEPILLEKKIYFETSQFPFKTTGFAVELAKAAKQIKVREGVDNVKKLLVMDIIIQLEPYVDNFYMQNWRDDCENVKKEFKRAITAPSSKWMNLITFINHTDSLKYPPDVWKDLLIDKELYYIKWQSPKGTVNVFTGREHGFIRSLVVGMIAIGPGEHWKAVALKYLIDKNERTLRPLLVDHNFSLIYQELNKIIYTPYIPWYFRIFMLIPLQSLNELFYEKAKEKIKQEQEQLGLKNENNNQKVNTEIDSKKKEVVTGVKDKFFSDSVKRTLDYFYSAKKHVPTINELSEYYPEVPDFLNNIKNKKFRIISLPIRGGENIEIVVYPDDDSWVTKKQFLIESLESVVADRNPHISVPVDMAKIEKAQNLLEILSQEIS